MEETVVAVAALATALSEALVVMVSRSFAFISEE
jgi:hypothetical protein